MPAELSPVSADARLEDEWLWRDPYPAAHGVLLSDYIHFYAQTCKMIEPFDDRSVQPASYELHVGGAFYQDDKPVEPDKDGFVTIPPNGLMYFSIQEKLNLPFYMTACHDLRVKQVYRGLLVGRSVHITPGYSGHINYPIFNFTNQDRTLRIGDAVGTIIFIKTTPFGTSEFWGQNRGIRSRQDLDRIKVQGIRGNECQQYKVSSTRSIPEYWSRGETHRSAVLELGHAFSRFEQKVSTQVSTVTTIGYIGLLALFVAAGTLAVQHFYWTADKVNGVTEKMARLESAVKKLDTIESIENRLKSTELGLNRIGDLDQIRRRLDSIEASLRTQKTARQRGVQPPTQPRGR